MNYYVHAQCYGLQQLIKLPALFALTTILFAAIPNTDEIKL